MRIPIIVFACLLLLFSKENRLAAQSSSVPAPGAAQQQPIYLTNGVIHTAAGQTFEGGSIAFVDGRITEVAAQTPANIPDGAEVVDLNGQHVYPGLISCASILGLVEVNALRPTRDYVEVGSFKPHVRSIIAYNTDSRVIPTVRANGVLMAQIIPAGGRISGTSSVVQLDAWNYEDALIKENDGVWLNWPDAVTRSGWWAEPGGMKANEKYAEQVREIEAFFGEARAYCDKPEPTTNLIFEAMCGVFDGSQTVYIQADHIKEIQSVLSFAKTEAINFVLVGGRDSWLATKELAEADVPIILDDTHELPYRPDDDIDLPFKLPGLLQEAGIRFAITSGNFYGAQRNLAFNAAKAVPYGLTEEEALRSLTVNPAEILGIADEVGTLEAGKRATLFISTGDMLDIQSNRVVRAFVDGREVDLNDKQKELYRKFMGKYGLETEGVD